MYISYINAQSIKVLSIVRCSLKQLKLCVEGEFMFFRSLSVQSGEITLFEILSLIYYYYECTSHGQKEKLCPVIYVS